MIMDIQIEKLVLEFLKLRCPIKKVRDKKDGKKRFVKTLFIMDGILDNSIKRFTFEKDNRHNLIMLGLIISVIDVVFALPLLDRNVIAAKYLGF